ncbi:MAG: hypothetical protein KIH64_002465 [Mycobacterium sp.]|nr:hypothetical protein [Mycobacterium sp.]
MNDFLDEHQYAWRLIRAARQVQSESKESTDNLVELLDAALDAGLDRTTLIVELARVGGRLLALWDPVVCLT